MFKAKNCYHLETYRKAITCDCVLCVHIYIDVSPTLFAVDDMSVYLILILTRSHVS